MLDSRKLEGSMYIYGNVYFDNCTFCGPGIVSIKEQVGSVPYLVNEID